MPSFFNLKEFIGEAADILKYSLQTGNSFEDTMKAVSAAKLQEEREKEEKERKKMEEALRHHYLLGAMTPKFAASSSEEKRGELSHKDMPQVSAWDANKLEGSKLVTIDPNELKFSQDKVNKTKVQGIINSWDKAKKNPIIISKDNYICDGHHRAAAAKEQGVKITAVQLNKKGISALEEVRELE